MTDKEKLQKICFILHTHIGDKGSLTDEILKVIRLKKPSAPKRKIRGATPRG